MLPGIVTRLLQPDGNRALIALTALIAAIIIAFCFFPKKKEQEVVQHDGRNHNSTWLELFIGGRIGQVVLFLVFFIVCYWLLCTVVPANPEAAPVNSEAAPVRSEAAPVSSEAEAVVSIESVTSITTPPPLDVMPARTGEAPATSSSPTIVHATPTPNPSCPKLEPCSKKKMSLKDLMLIKYDGNAELRLLDNLSPYWMSFWKTVGFKIAQLMTQLPNTDLNIDRGKKLSEVFQDWMAGRFNRKGYAPTYANLVRVLEDITLSDLASEFEKAIKGTEEVKMTDKVDLSRVMLIKYKDEDKGKEVRVWDTLKDHWESFAGMIGYNVHSPNTYEQAFRHFFRKWQEQGFSKQSREKYPATFEGFRAALKDVERYVEEYEKAVQQACICQFST